MKTVYGEHTPFLSSYKYNNCIWREKNRCSTMVRKKNQDSGGIRKIQWNPTSTCDSTTWPQVTKFLISLGLVYFRRILRHQLLSRECSLPCLKKYRRITFAKLGPVKYETCNIWVYYLKTRHRQAVRDIERYSQPWFFLSISWLLEPWALLSLHFMDLCIVIGIWYSECHKQSKWERIILSGLNLV